LPCHHQEMINNFVLGPVDEWRELAACRSHPAVLFFGVDDTESSADRRAREEEAKRVCFGCRVRQQCLEYSLDTKEPYGIWGGLTEAERKARLRSRAARRESPVA
jgi:WhiB family transcriptional regulator, redox-sensing transcriptional regulator